MLRRNRSFIGLTSWPEEEARIWCNWGFEGVFYQLWGERRSSPLSVYETILINTWALVYFSHSTEMSHFGLNSATICKTENIRGKKTNLAKLFLFLGWDYISELPSLTDILFIPQMIWVGERRWNDTDRGKPKTRRKTCPRATLSTTNPTWIDPGANPGLCGQNPATNRLIPSTTPV
jgi:hypothetical protein